ncbi:MAG: RDD family protein [Candidatus Marinimicrobia bacterium]|nr:RDD family protein [Candidatus Neomarinimicrobiota bacterium]
MVGDLQENHSKQDLEYVGFWLRVWAAIIDSILIMMIIIPILIHLYGWSYFTTPELVSGPVNFIISGVLPVIAIIAFWVAKSATPGKMAISAKIVNARTGQKPSTAQFIGRYFAYYISIIPFCLGLIWVAFDKKKQGWHDKLVGTVVVRPRVRGKKPVEFNQVKSIS